MLRTAQADPRIIIPYYKEEWFRIATTMRSILRHTDLKLLKDVRGWELFDHPRIVLEWLQCSSLYSDSDCNTGPPKRIHFGNNSVGQRPHSFKLS